MDATARSRRNTEMQFNVKGSIILLFATDKKWDLNNIKLKAVTAQGIFFDASCPALVIDQTAKKPIRVGNAEEVLEAAGRDVTSERLEKDYGWHYTKIQDIPFLLDIARQETLTLCASSATNFEKRFLNFFFEHLIDESKDDLRHAASGGTSREFWIGRAKSRCDALMPIPQAWFYCHDPLKPYAFIPENAFRVDFAFWSGEKFYAR
jgi:hypothetical protein